MEKKKISVIIIIYEVAQYLDRCLETVMNQSYSNLEIILVSGTNPEGRDDGCLAKCRKAAAKDSRIKVVTCMAKGAADARNHGLAEVTGDLIGFVDGDDYIERDYFSHLSQLMTKFKADIAVSGRFYEYRNETLSDPIPENGPYAMTPQQALDTVISGTGFYLHCWDKLYDSALWKGVVFPPDKHVEDRIIVNKIIGKAKRIVYDSTPGYHFRERLESLSKKGNIAYDNYLANVEFADYIHKNFPALSEKCDRYMLYENITAIQNMHLSGNKNKEELSIYKNEIASLISKIHIQSKNDYRLIAKAILALNAPGLLTFNTKRKNKKNTLIRFK